MAEPIGLKYRAFISYSHTDTSWAKWLHGKLEGFPIDKDLVGRETATGAIPKTLRPIFRDRDDFTAGHTLTDQTLAALDASHALIVVCSPASAKSHYVTEEIRIFKSRHPDRQVIPLIVGGTPDDPKDECFSSALKFKVTPEGEITTIADDPLGADVRDEGDGRHLALAKVVAGLLGVSSDDVFRRAERERRRKGRVRNGIIAVLAILAIAASGSAVYAWQQLKTNEAFLNATLQRATEIVNTAVAQAEKHGVPRTATLELLSRAEGLFDDMSRLGRTTPELRHRKALMLIEFARNYQLLGDSRKRRERSEEAHRLLVGLADERPGDVNYQQDLSRAQIELGNVLVAQNNLSAAQELYTAALRIRRHLVESAPKEDRQSDLAQAFDKVGEVLKRQGNLAEALKLFQDSHAILVRLVKIDGDNAKWQADLWRSHRSVGDTLVAQGKTLEALTVFRDSIPLAERRAKAEPSHWFWQSALAASYERVGDRLVVTQANLDEAFTFYRDSCTIRERLAKGDPDNAWSQRDLSICYERIGNMLSRQDNLGEALKSYGDALAIAQQLARLDPENAEWQADVSVVHCHIGDALMAQGNSAQALHSYQQSLAIADRVLKGDPSNVPLQRRRSVFQRNIANVLAMQGNLAAAVKSYKDECAIPADPGNGALQHDLAMTHAKFALVFVQQGNSERALEELQQGRAIVTRLIQQFPDDAEFHESLATFEADIAKLQERPGAAQP